MSGGLLSELSELSLSIMSEMVSNIMASLSATVAFFISLEFPIANESEG